MPIGAILGAASGLASAFGSSGPGKHAKKNSVFNPGDISGGFGDVNFTQDGPFGARTAEFTQDQQTQQLMQLLQNQAGAGFSGNQDFQQALAGNNLTGAHAGAQGMLGQQFGNTAFGGLGGLAGGATGLANQFGAQTQQGLQDFTGGAQSGLFGMGFQNQQDAANTSGLVAQNLAASDALAAPGENRIINNFANREFMGTRGATSGAQERQGILADSLLSAGNQRVMNAQQLGLQNQQQLGQLGLGQSAQGGGLFGQNIQNFLGGAGMAQNFAGQAGQFEGQQFGQNLTGQQQNISQGQQRLANSMNLFGTGSALQQQDLAAAGGVNDANLAQNQFQVNTIQGGQNAEANRIGGAGQSASAIQQGDAAQAGMRQGALLGLFDQFQGGGTQPPSLFNGTSGFLQGQNSLGGFTGGQQKPQFNPFTGMFPQV